MGRMKAFNFGPLALTTTYTTNILNPPTATGGVNGGSSAQYIVLKHVSIVNKTTSAATFRLFRGATNANAAGTEIIGYDLSVAANNVFNWYGLMRFDSTDFLVGGAGTATALTIQGEGEIGVAG